MNTIRLATEMDREAIVSIKKEVYKEFVQSHPELYKMNEIVYTDTFINTYLNSSECFPLVYYKNDMICGFLLAKEISVNLPMMKSRTFIYVDDVAVLPTYRQMGIASYLFDTIEEIALKKGIKTVELAVHQDNTDALSLYHRKGYAVRTYRMAKKII